MKICDDSNRKPLKLILQSCLGSEKFPSEQKKPKVVSVRKKNDYEISLLAFTGKLHERLLYNRIFETFTEISSYEVFSQFLNLYFRTQSNLYTAGTL